MDISKNSGKALRPEPISVVGLNIKYYICYNYKICYGLSLRSHMRHKTIYFINMFYCLLLTNRRHFPKYEAPPAKNITHKTPIFWFGKPRPSIENQSKNASSFQAKFLLWFSHNMRAGVYRIYLSNTFIEYCDNFICI